ncbi:MAG: tol-pal system protein YbgF [Halieaceae bacterium]|uniref:tol-pal system protein YbgF n=1 Tax=Haliea alexandrii TaxID=2448162 RepID=UPI000F0B058E|nr:tol-pal system protein YbgF [Haliea alexandrii]MCR9185860.1 tol-pal system protein YbgF [Halieaceae bacterium]
MLLFGKAFTRALLANGLALVVGPFCVLAQAQDYIDVEAERAAAEGRAASSAPASRSAGQGAQPAQAYPVTSYGIGTATNPEQSASTVAPVAPAPVAAAGGNAGQLMLQVQQLQQEVMRLNGVVEEQAHELRTLKSQSLERYLDIDRRLSLLAGGSVDGAELPTAGPAAVDSTAAAAPRPEAAGAAATTEQPGEAAAYQAAYALVRGQKFDEAVSAFQQFLRDYPAGRFTPNAHYWLGELYLVTTPPDVESARQSFMLLLDLYPADSKVPDALFKLGKIHFTKGNRDRAREFFDRVINEYGASNSAAVKLAQDFINENY